MAVSDYSYQGFNPGAGLSDFAQTMRQGYQDQQALREQQMKNLLQAHQQEAMYGPLSNTNNGVDSSLFAPESVQSGEQDLIDKSHDRPVGPILDTRNGQTSFVQTPAQSAPANTAATPRAAAAQAGQAPAESPQDLQNDQAEPGLQKDGSFVAKNKQVVPAANYRVIQELGGTVDPDTGAANGISNFKLHNLIQTHDKIQSALANAGSRALSAIVNPEKAQIIPAQRPAAAPRTGGASPLDLAYKGDPVLQGYLRTLSSPAIMPDQRNDILNNKIPQRQVEIQRSLSGHVASGGNNAPPTQIKVSNGSKTFLIDPSHLADAQKDGFKQVQ